MGCVTCSYRISKNSKTASSGDLQLQSSVIVLDQCKVNLHISNATELIAN